LAVIIEPCGRISSWRAKARRPRLPSVTARQRRRCRPRPSLGAGTSSAQRLTVSARIQDVGPVVSLPLGCLTAVRVPHCGQAAPVPSRADAMMIARTRTAIRANEKSRWTRNHIPIVATRIVGSAIRRTIPVEIRWSAPDRALTLDTGNIIPVAMSPHDSQLPRPKSRIRRLFKRSGVPDVEGVMFPILRECPTPRGPSGPPRQAARPRRSSEASRAR